MMARQSVAPVADQPRIGAKQLDRNNQPNLQVRQTGIRSSPQRSVKRDYRDRRG